MYTLDSDPSRKLIIAEMTGFLTVDEVENFSRDEQALIRVMGWRSGEYLLLIRTGGTAIQSQEVVAKFMEIVARSPLKAKKIAVVRGSSLTRLQTHRILSIRDNAAIFAHADEAEAWLVEDLEGAAASGVYGNPMRARAT